MKFTNFMYFSARKNKTTYKKHEKNKLAIGIKNNQKQDHLTSKKHRENYKL